VYGLDIRCIRIKPCRLAEHVLVDVQQFVPLPEATEYQVRIQRKVQKVQEERSASSNNRDLTKYDVTINGETHGHLAKGRAVLLAVKYLCEQGVSPEQISTTVNWRISDLWLWTDGTLNAAEFRVALSEARASEGRTYEPRRVFGNDDQLIHAEGKTFAFTTQWVGDEFVIVMDQLCAANLMPGTVISYTKSL